MSSATGRPLSTVASMWTNVVLWAILLVLLYIATMFTFFHAEIVSCSKDPKVASPDTCIVHTGPISRNYP